MLAYPVITALSAGVLIILQILLMLHTSNGRLKYQKGLGDGGEMQMLIRMRMHGNLAENAPIFLIVMALLEVAGVNQIILAIAAALFVIARIVHPIGLMQTNGRSMFRFFSTIYTMLLGFVGGIYLIITALGQL